MSHQRTITPALRAAHAANRAAIDAAGHYDRNSMVKRQRDAFVAQFGRGDKRYGSLEFAKRVASNCLTNAEGVWLMMDIIDKLDGVHPNLREEIENSLMEIYRVWECGE